jgi:branched-chain amino acid aminotransferase
MSRVVSIDGAIVSPGDAKVSVYDRGFLYGDAVFEVLRTYAGVPFALGEHVARLRRSADRVLIAMPISDADLAAEITRAIEAAKNSESYARVVLTRGAGPLGLDPELASAPLRVILVEPVHPPPREAYADGVALATIHTKRAVDDTAAAGAKVSNYLANLLAVHEAKKRGAAEALIIDAHGHVVEGASSNIFVARGGTLVTPPESEGILAGITRAHVIELARALGVPCDLRALFPTDLYGADEAFITSSVREVIPAVIVDGRRIGDGKPGPLTRRLHRAFRERVGLGKTPLPWEKTA